VTGSQGSGRNSIGPLRTEGVIVARVVERVLIRHEGAEAGPRRTYLFPFPGGRKSDAYSRAGVTARIPRVVCTERCLIAFWPLVAHSACSGTS
jgi:hypothetical protein